MKRVIKLMMIFVFLMFAGKGFSQNAVQSSDTLRNRQQQSEQQNDQQQVQQEGQQTQEQAGIGNAVKAVKQVKGSRPDMSKAKGARPPMIVRPSGSGVPKGVGKPGGVGRKGGK